MKCPVCQTKELYPTQLTFGLAALSCNQCGGCLIDLLSYRLWAKEQFEATTQERQQPQAVDDNRQAMSCSKCDRLMSKYRISEEVDNKIDLCASCGHVWLDGGEWELLQSMELSTMVPHIIATPWQTRIRQNENHQRVEVDIESKLGSEDFSKAKEFQQWLEEHPQKVLIRRLIMNP